MNASTMGPATTGLVWEEATMSVPKRRNTAATMAMTMGMGMAAMIRRTRPVAPNARMSRPATKKVPTTSGNDRCCRDGPSSTVPGIDHANPRGWR